MRNFTINRVLYNFQVLKLHSVNFTYYLEILDVHFFVLYILYVFMYSYSTYKYLDYVLVVLYYSLVFYTIKFKNRYIWILQSMYFKLTAIVVEFVPCTVQSNNTKRCFN